MLRLLDLRNRHALHNSARVQHREPVAQLQDGKQVMGDIKEGGSMATGQLPQQLDDLSLGYRVEGTGGLVGYQDGGAVQKGQSD
jgi:hypothetical protein